MKPTLVSCFVLAAACASNASAAVIAANNVSVLGANSANSSGSNFANTNNRNGLSTTLTDANLSTVTHVQGFSASTQYLTQGAASTGTLDATIQYSWSAALTDQLTTIAVWNFSQVGQPNRWADSITVSYTTGDPASGTYLSLGTFALSNPGQANPVLADLIDVSASNLVGVTGVRLKLNQSKLDTFNNFTSGLGEVAFQTIPVPEPSVALLGGLGVLGMLRRRRTKC